MSTRAMAAAALWTTLAAPAPALAGGAPAEPPPSINVTVPSPPPADQPLVQHVPRPEISVEGGAGVLGYINGAGRLGPAWNVRVTAEFTPRFAAEANYLGSVN